MIVSVLRDVMTFGGLATLGVGLWWIEPAYSLVVVGGILFVSGAVAARRLKVGK